MHFYEIMTPSRYVKSTKMQRILYVSLLILLTASSSFASSSVSPIDRMPELAAAEPLPASWWPCWSCLQTLESSPWFDRSTLWPMNTPLPLCQVGNNSQSFPRQFGPVIISYSKTSLFITLIQYIRSTTCPHIFPKNGKIKQGPWRNGNTPFERRNIPKYEIFS